MTPVKFPQANAIYGAGQPEYIPLPAHRTPDGHEVTACWHMSWRERIRCLFTGNVFVTILTFGDALAPSRVTLDPPETQK
jgi:hypothetical protein